MTTTILLRTSPNNKPDPISPIAYVRCRRGYVQLGAVAIGGPVDLLASVLRSLADDLEKPQKPTVIPQRAYDRVLSMTPLDVVHYFEQSPILMAHAGDVRAALLTDEMAQIDQLQQDVQAVINLDQPSLADISEVLTGSRQYGGATYKRVKAVAEALESTTTTPSERLTGVVILKKAA